MHTIGILLPRSTYYVGIGFDIFEGLKASLDEHKPDTFRIVTENIGFGADKQQCYRGAEQLLMHHDARIVFAYVSHRIAQVLRPLFTAANRVLVVLDSGANLPQEWPSSPNIFFLSLHNSLGTLFSARLAAKDGNRQSGIVTGYYDGGYLHTFAAFNGYTGPERQICFNHATGYGREDFSMQPLTEHLKAYPDSAIIALFSGDYTQWFFEELNRYFPGKELPVYLSPFSLEETMLAQAAFPGKNVKGIAAWSSNLPGEANQRFVQSMDQRGRTANLFSLLGWEAGLMLADLSDREISLINSRETAEGLRTLQLETPRGLLRFHPTLQHSLAPLYKVHITADDSGHCALVVDEVIEDVSTDFEELASVPLESSVSGWFNSYTCI
jgi:branched-chain amino acid transport system substrate-binding protein